MVGGFGFSDFNNIIKNASEKFGCIFCLNGYFSSLYFALSQPSGKSVWITSFGKSDTERYAKSLIEVKIFPSFGELTAKNVHKVSTIFFSSP